MMSTSSSRRSNRFFRIGFFLYCSFILLIGTTPSSGFSVAPDRFAYFPNLRLLSKPVSSSATTSKPAITLLSSSSSSLDVSSSKNGQNNNDKAGNENAIRDRLRKLTGFSLTALRATMRAATGISLTAIYAGAVAATSSFVRKIMTFFLAVFPTWFRYFLQPFLVLYYVPLFILRNLTGPTRKRARESHEFFLEGWKQAVQAAEEAQEDGYWPVHVNEDGFIVPVLPPDPANKQVGNEIDILESVAESVEVVMEKKSSETTNETQAKKTP